jgi:hypothetical protein
MCYSHLKGVVQAAKRLLLLSLLAAFVCGLALRFYFPGYLDPLVPFHLDHYIYIGMHAEGYGISRYFRYYPRPVAHILIDLCGRLGVYGLLAPLYVLTFLNAALIVLYLERILKVRIGWPGLVLFAALGYSNPEFYWNLKQDPFSVFALTFLLCIFHAWQSYIKTGKRIYPIAIVALALLLSLTKESYFGALALFLIIQARERRAALPLLLASAACMGFGVFWSARTWTLFDNKADPGSVYYTSLAPGSLWHGFLKIGKYLAVPAVGVAVIAALVRARQIDRRLFFASSAAVLLGAASLLPNATLPNHLEAQYAFLGGYFFLAPLLFADRLVPSRAGLLLAGLVIYGLALLSYQRSTRDVAGWLREQEQIARRMLPGIERLKSTTNPGDSSLVIGATMFYDPFLAPEFILSEFGRNRSWTVVVPDNIGESKRYTTQLIHDRNPARLAKYDHLFVFAPDGELAIRP